MQRYQQGVWGAVQVPPKSRAALQVNEARLALLLQAVRTSLQLPASAHSFRLAAVDITSHLARCQVSLLGAAAPTDCRCLLSGHLPIYWLCSCTHLTRSGTAKHSVAGA